MLLSAPILTMGRIGPLSILCDNLSETMVDGRARERSMTGIERRGSSPKMFLALATGALFTDVLCYDMIVPFLPEHLKAAHVSETSIGLLFSAYSATFLLAAPLMGALANRPGRWHLIRWGILALLASAVLTMLTDSYIGLVSARLIQGVGASAIWTGGLAGVAARFDSSQRGWALGIVMGGISLATLIAPPLGGFLFERGGIALPFFCMSCWTLAVLTVLHLFPAGDGAGATPSVLNREWLHLPSLRNRRFLAPIGLVVIGATAISLLEPTLPLHLGQRMNAGPEMIGLLFASSTLAYGLSSPLAGYVSDRYGRTPTMAMGLLATAVLLPTVALPASGWGEVGVLAPLGVAFAFLLSPTLPELADVTEKEGGQAYGSAYAVFTIAYAGGQMIGPMAGTALSARFGFLAGLLILGALAAGYLPLLLWARRQAKPQPEVDRSLAA